MEKHYDKWKKSSNNSSINYNAATLHFYIT